MLMQNTSLVFNGLFDEALFVVHKKGFNTKNISNKKGAKIMEKTDLFAGAGIDVKGVTEEELHGLRTDPAATMTELI